MGWQKKKLAITDGPSLHDLLLSFQVCVATRTTGRQGAEHRFQVSFSGDWGVARGVTITGLEVVRSTGIDVLRFKAETIMVTLRNLEGEYNPRTRGGVLYAEEEEGIGRVEYH